MNEFEHKDSNFLIRELRAEYHTPQLQPKYTTKSYSCEFYFSDI
jgi:hypothetical protein